MCGLTVHRMVLCAIIIITDVPSIFVVPCYTVISTITSQFSQHGVLL